MFVYLHKDLANRSPSLRQTYGEAKFQVEN